MITAYTTFQDSFDRTVEARPREFFDSFYKRFLASDPQVAKLFSRTDMARQAQMLRESFAYVIDFAKLNAPDGRMAELAKRHNKAHVNVEPRLYDLWLKCLIETVREFDPLFDPVVEGAWRDMLEPGIRYMKSQYLVGVPG